MAQPEHRVLDCLPTLLVLMLLVPVLLVLLLLVLVLRLVPLHPLSHDEWVVMRLLTLLAA